MTKTLTPEGAEKQAIHGWDGSAWKKLPMLWGFSSSLRLSVSQAAPSDGDKQEETGDVPAGEIWVVQQIQLRNRDTASSSVEVQVRNGGFQGTLLLDTTPVIDEWSMTTGEWVLVNDEHLTFYWRDCLQDDRLDGAALGYKMKVAE